MSGMSHKSWSAFLKKSSFQWFRAGVSLSLLQMEHCGKQWAGMKDDLCARFDILIILRLFSAPDASLLFAHNHLLCYDLPGLKNTFLCHTMCLYPLILFSLSSFFIPLCQALLNTTNSTPLSTANASIDPPWPVIVLNCTTCYIFSPQDNRLCGCTGFSSTANERTITEGRQALCPNSVFTGMHAKSQLDLRGLIRYLIYSITSVS